MTDIGEGKNREEVYSVSCCLLILAVSLGAAVAVIVAILLPTVFIPYLYPLFHLEGLSLEIAVTMCVALCFSAVNALTLSPALCALILKPVDPNKKKSLFFIIKISL